MLKYRDFYKKYNRKDVAQKKYLTALFQHFAFGGFVSYSLFGNPGDRKRSNDDEGGGASAGGGAGVVGKGSEPGFHGVVLSGRANNHGFVNIMEGDECLLDEAFRELVVSKQTGRAWQAEFATAMDELQIENSNHSYIFETYIARMEQRFVEEHFQDIGRLFMDLTEKTPEELSADTFPVYIREGCFEAKNRRRLPQTCSDVQKYFYFGVCSIRIQPVLHFLSFSNLFSGLFPYSYGHFTDLSIPCKKHLIQFLTDDRFVVMCYSVKIRGSETHLAHMRFAVKDVVSRRVLLFDPHGRFYLSDEGTEDVVRFQTVLKELTYGLPVVKVSDEQHIISFPSYDERFRESLQVPSQHLSTVVVGGGGAGEEGHIFLYKPPIGIDRIGRSEYKGDQSLTEGSCAMACAMRALHIAHSWTLSGRQRSPLEFLDTPVQCQIPFLLSLNAQSFGDVDFDYSNMDDRSMVAVCIQKTSEPDRIVCTGMDVSRANPLLSRRIETSDFVYEALLRAHYSKGLAVEDLNPYRYRFEHRGSFVQSIIPIDQPIDGLGCEVCELERAPTPCFYLIQLPPHTFFVPFQIFYFDREVSQSRYLQLELVEDEARTVREIFGPVQVDPRARRSDPIRGETHYMFVYMMPQKQALNMDLPFHSQFAFTSFPRQSTLHVVFKKHEINVGSQSVRATSVEDIVHILRSRGMQGTTLQQNGQDVVNLLNTHTEDPFEFV